MSKGASTPSHRLWYHNGTLPHFDAADLIQAITFRLADSLPLQVLERIDRDVEAKYHDDDVRSRERRRRIDAAVDRGLGSCLLRLPTCAAIVRDTMLRDHGQRCWFLAWVIMPNHVHVLIRQIEGHPLASLVQTWKSLSARRIATLTGTTGGIWQRDYWDRHIRDADHYARCVDYIHRNPVTAGLVHEIGAWPWSSAYRKWRSEGVAPRAVDGGVDAPFVDGVALRAVDGGVDAPSFGAIL